MKWYNFEPESAGGIGTFQIHSLMHFWKKIHSLMLFWKKHLLSMCHFMSVRFSLSLWWCISSWTRHYYIAWPSKCKWILQHMQLAVDGKTHVCKSLIKNPKQMQRLHEEVLLTVTATALRAPLVPRSMKPRNIMYWAQFLLIPFACWFSFSISFWIPFPQVSAHLRWNSKLLRDKKNANRHLGILIILLVFQLPKGRLSYPVLSFLLCHGF